MAIHAKCTKLIKGLKMVELESNVRTGPGDLQFVKLRLAYMFNEICFTLFVNRLIGKE